MAEPRRRGCQGWWGGMTHHHRPPAPWFGMRWRSMASTASVGQRSRSLTKQRPVDRGPARHRCPAGRDRCPPSVVGMAAHRANRSAFSLSTPGHQPACRRARTDRRKRWSPSRSISTRAPSSRPSKRRRSAEMRMSPVALTPTTLTRTALLLFRAHRCRRGAGSRGNGPGGGRLEARRSSLPRKDISDILGPW